MTAEDFAAYAESLGLSLSKAQLELFDRFEESLYHANEVTNLTRVERQDCKIRHFLDSLLFQDLIPVGATVLDIGTGPGFPAWPLACARPDLRLTALDSSGKMLGFLKSQPLPNLLVVSARAEEWRKREAFDFVTGRAVAPLSAQLEISAAFAKIGGQVIPMRSPADIEALDRVDLKPLGLNLVRVLERRLVGSDTTRVFPLFQKAKSTSANYPRRWAELKRNPL